MMLENKCDNESYMSHQICKEGLNRKFKQTCAWVVIRPKDAIEGDHLGWLIVCSWVIEEHEAILQTILQLAPAGYHKKNAFP